jgi:hypothetical protein
VDGKARTNKPGLNNSQNKKSETENSHVLVKEQIQQLEVNEITLEFQKKKQPMLE